VQLSVKYIHQLQQRLNDIGDALVKSLPG